MNNHFTLINLQNFINVYSYPVIVINEDNYPILKNSYFYKTEKNEDFVIQKKLTDSIHTDEYSIKSNDKTSTYSLNYSKLIIEKNKYKIISFFDISIKNKLIEELIEKQNLFNNLTEQLPEGVALFEDNLIYTNDTFENLLGYSSKNLHQKKLIELIDVQYKTIFQDNLEKLMTSRKLIIEDKLKLIKNDSSLVSVKIKIKKIKQQNKNLFLAVITNISKELQHIKELSLLANYDKLTGIYNRRKFEELLNTEYKITKRYGRHLSALFFDIDHFKKVNDTYGHDTGDIVLSNFANLISQQIRETDVFARWGGEEFILLLPETTDEQAVVIANDIMLNLSIFNFPKVGKVTVSIGISSVKKEHLHSFLKRLDNALYKSKQAGRNRYTIL